VPALRAAPGAGGLLAGYLEQVPAERRYSVVLQIATSLVYAPPAFLDSVSGLREGSRETPGT